MMRDEIDGVVKLIGNTKIIWMLVCASISQTAYAEDMTAGQGFSGDIALGGNQNKGNTNITILDGNIDVVYKYQKLVSEFTFQASQISDANVITSDYYDTILKEKYYLTTTVYALLRLGYREDFFGGIYSEKSYVSGLGYHAFTDEPKYSVDFELGYGQRISKKVNKIRVDYDLGTHLAVIAQYDFTGKDKIKAQVMGEFGNDDDYIKQTFSWVHELVDNLNADFSYEARTQTAPAFGKVRTDTMTVLKLGYSF